MVKILGIEGLPGAGKSHFLHALSERVDNITVFLEPVETFTKLKSYDPLSLLYSNPAKYGVSTQIHIINQLRHYWSSILALADMDRPLFIEHSPETARVFIETLRELGYITDFDAHVLNDSLDIILCDSGSKTSCDKLIFLDLPTPDLIHRILEVRKRPCELTASEEFWNHYLTTLRKDYWAYLEKFRAEHGADSVLVISTEDTYVLTEILSFAFK